MILFAATLAIAVIGALAATEVMLRRHVIPFDGLETARTLFRTGDAPVAVFGDSRVANGLASNEQVANFGSPADSLTTVLEKAEAWNAKRPGGKLIVALEPQQFSRQRLTADQNELLADFVGRDTALLQITRRVHRRFLLQYVGALIRDPAQLWRQPQPPRTIDPAAEPAFADMPAPAQKREAEIRSQHHAPVAGFSNTQLARSLNTRLERLRDNGTQLCLITMPVTAAYRRVAEDEPRFAEVRAFYANVAKSLDAPYLDLWSAYPDTMFQDPDHMLTRAHTAITGDILKRCFGQ